MEEYKANLFQKTITVAMALLCGKDVGRERMVKRVEICVNCEYVSKQGTGESGLLRCGICKCRIRGDAALINLARYEEVNGRYGCKHPSGSRWKAAGI